MNEDPPERASRSGAAAAARSFAELLRPANVVTAAADVLAGWCIAGAAVFGALGLLAGASMCLYAGGVALNDVADAPQDAKERPERPIPSGRISRRNAAIVASLLLIGGVALACVFSGAAGWIALAIALAVLAYNASLKRSPIAAPFGMAACRGLNLALGMSASTIALGQWWGVAAISAGYIACVTALAHHETQRRIPQSLAALPLAGAVIATLGWLIIGVWSDRVDGVWAALGLIVFLLMTTPAQIRAVRNPIPRCVRPAIGASVLGLIALNAAIAAGFAGPVYGLLTLALLPVSLLLAHRFAVT